MSNNLALQQARKDEAQSSGGSGRKTSSLRPPEQTLKCPRCDSTNTKFCYYNNYNLTQPRHFCKACRRYWTKGGALRNIPIGGGCRKNKKTKSSTSKFITIGDYSSSNKLLDGLSSPPVMDFQLGSRLNLFPPRFNQFSSSYGDTSSNNLPFMNLDPLGVNFGLSTNVTKHGGHGGGTANCQEMGFIYTNNLHQNTSNIASSIESLSSLNQDLHWKLQQHRLATLFGGEEHDNQQHQQKEPILFQNLEISKPTGGTSRKSGSGSGDGGGGGGGMVNEWFFSNSYASANVNPGSTENDQNGDINTWNRIQAWNHMNQYSPLP